MNQMALMAQMASSIGMMNGAPFAGPGYPIQGMPGDMNMFQGGMNNGYQGPQQMGGNAMNPNTGGRGRGGARGGRGGPTRGRGGSTSISTTPKSTDIAVTPAQDSATTPSTLPIAAPAPITPNTGRTLPTSLNSVASPLRSGFVVPERPQSPTLCKFNMKCTNAHCRYAHPSPVATAESGVVLSNEACEKGRDCQDKDCIKGHVSPAVLNPQRAYILLCSLNFLTYDVLIVAEQAPSPSVISPTHTATPCRFGTACTRHGCSFAHPGRPASHSGQTAHFTQQCRFGAGCTRSTCPFQHPEGRVLPTTFHRGLSTTGPMVTISAPETGSMGNVASPHRSVKFNKPSGLGLGVKEKMQQQLKEIEERKMEAEKAVREAEAAAAATNGKKDESKPVAIAA